MKKVKEQIKIKKFPLFPNSFYFLAVVFIFYFLLFTFSFAAIDDEISNRQKQIEELQRQINEYQYQIENNRSQSRTLETEIGILNAQISQIQLTIRSLELSINQTSLEITDTEGSVFDIQEKMVRYKETIGQLLQITYENDQKSLTEIVLSNENLSDFFTVVDSIRVNQEKLKITIDELKVLKINLEERQNNLEEQRAELERSRNLEAIEKRSLDGIKYSKDKILRDTKGEEQKFQNLVNQSQQNIEALRAQITYLELNGVTAEEAVKYGQLAAIATGIRPAYLIAVLEVESGLGRNVGKCNRAGDPPEKGYRNIMKPSRDIQPFLTITAELGLDPETTAVSCPQYVNGRQYGWGGAMGPAQFIPSTWMGYKNEVSQIVGRSANPWNIEDAFTAAAVKLARGGAGTQTRAAEVAASKAYYSGKSWCSTAPCNSYANAIQRKAAEIEKNL